MSIPKFNKATLQAITVVWAVISTFFAFYDEVQTSKLKSVQTTLTLIDSKLSRYLEKTHTLEVRLAILETKQRQENTTSYE